MAAAEHGVLFSGEASPDRAAGLAGQLRLVADGKLQVQVAEVLPLAQGAKAQQLSEEGHGRGKLVLKP